MEESVEMKDKDQYKKGEYIAIKDLKLWKANIFWKYSVILCCIIISFIFALIWAGDESVGTYIGFSGTILSIVLSVIAILITLIDVAGQKGQVLEISESAKKLRELLNEQKVDYQNMNTELNILIKEDLIEVLKNNLESTKKFTEEVRKNFIQEEKKEAFEKLADKYYNNINIKYSNLMGDMDSTFTMYLDYDLNYKEMNDMERNLRKQGLFVSLGFYSDKSDENNPIYELNINYVKNETNPLLIREKVNNYIKYLIKQKSKDKCIK